MPASMMMAVTGDIPKVTGSSTATPADGPIPGSAPMTVPRNTPKNANSRLTGASATSKPSSRLSKPIAISEAERAARNRHVEQVDEDDIDEEHCTRTRGNSGHDR